MRKLGQFHPLEIATLLLVMMTAIWLIPQFGTQHDEILFAKPVFNSRMSHATLLVGTKPLPLMIMSYTGALKVYVYKLVFAIFPPTLWSVRLPPLLALFGTTLFVRAALLRMNYKCGATTFVVLFVASPIIIVTCVFDWGPVCLQFILFGGVVYFLSRGAMEQDFKWFALAGLFFGLGVWDKLTFLICFAPVTFVLAGATLWQLPRTKRLKTLAALGSCALLGATPFLIAAAQNRTHSVSQLEIETESIGTKYAALSHSMVGTVLTGYITSRDQYVESIPDLLPKAWARVAEHILVITDYDRWVLLILLLTSLAITGRTQGMRALLFAGFAISWTCMALFRNLGGSGHHTVLLHPVLLLILALAIDDGWPQPKWRYAAAITASLLVVLNLASLSDFLMRVHYLPIPTVWSPAISKAATTVAALQTKNVYVDDWGLENAVILFSKGRVWPDSAVPENWRESISDFDLECANKAVSNRGAIFLGFAPGREQLPKGPKLLAEAAQSKDLIRVVVQEVKDRWGQSVVQIYRYQPR